MTNKRCYGDACGIARALDAVGDRWTLMVVRELMLGPKRFTDLRRALPRVGPDVLAQRLRDLEAGALVVRDTLPPPAHAQVYVLTPKGRALENVLVELGRWGGANADPPTPGMSMSEDAHLLSLQSLFDPALAEDFAATITLHLGESAYHATVCDGRITVARGAAPDADATIHTSPESLIAVAHKRCRCTDAIADGQLRITGDEDLGARFLQLFTLPSPAATDLPAA
ncbi:winged helix-turn-helix transcriptional regulator [Paraconexibacter sp.]|uniref:winged helix-turn-helix transcriptional regulator n=1 Tax=Paraconexibacter sp. TaxID=2949640 RepID=UPI00356283AA